METMDTRSTADPERGTEWPITYHYLTFDTLLPTPSRPDFDRDELNQPLPEDPDLRKYRNPFGWKQSEKTLITILSCIATAFTAFAAGGYSAGGPQMAKEWHVSFTATLIGISTFTTGFGIAPMVLAPFSEINGRRPVFIASGIMFVVFQICCAVTQSFPGMLVSRFFVGASCSTFSTMVGGVLADIYHTADRNAPMALFSGSVFFGTGMGPFVTGFVAQNASFRWIFWLQAIMDGALIVVIIAFFRETRGSVLLSRKAKVLNTWYAELEKVGCFGVEMPSEKEVGGTIAQRIRWKVKSDEERENIGKMIGISLYRPFHLLVTEPVVFFFSIWAAFAWAVLYMTFDAIPLVMRKVYGFSIQECGAAFASISIAAVLFTIVTVYQEKIAVKHNKLPKTPEARLYFACVESVLMGAGLLIFGWTSRPEIHWAVPLIGIGMTTMGIFSIYLAVFNYLADTYHRYASSAIAAKSFCRNMFGGAFPLVTGPLYVNLGFGSAGSLLAGIAFGLTLVPWVLVLYGPSIRRRSKFANEIMDSDE